MYGTASNVGRLIHTYFPYNFAKTLIPTLSYGKNADLEGPIEEHALAMDMIALLSRHEAIATAQVNRNSKIHDSTQAIKFGQVVMDTIDPAIRSKKRALRLIIEEGELDEHTDNPSVRWRNERIALSGLTGIFAGLRFLQPEDVIGKSGQVQQT